MTVVPQVHQLVVDEVVDEAHANLDDAERFPRPGSALGSPPAGGTAPTSQQHRKRGRAGHRQSPHRDQGSDDRGTGRPAAASPR